MVVLSTACGKTREREDAVACATWGHDIAPALAAACGTCHGEAPAGSYDVRSYAGVLGLGSDDLPNVVAGSPNSTLLVTLAPDTARSPHAGFTAEYQLLSTWIVSCDARYANTILHRPGLMNPASDDFHGREVEAQGWDLTVCARCHGADFSGTTAAPSCTTCHEEGPTACTTCHAAVPTTGAHERHTPTFACSECHVVPTAWDDEGHVRRGGQGDPPPAEVMFGALANQTLDPADRGGPAALSADTTCSNVYCHGAVLGPAGGENTTPRWYAPQRAPDDCAGCHGAPPPNHASDVCSACHPSGATHLDGAVGVGTGGQACSACHGSEASPAPPRDLSGNQFTSALGVGAHQAHLQGPSRLAAPVACETCHAVPAMLQAAGHIDSSAPAEVTASLGWDRTTATCATAWCHGDTQPAWTSHGAVTCGSCHALPPPTSAHVGPMTIGDCATCHATAVDSVGNVILPAHANGVIDAF